MNIFLIEKTVVLIATAFSISIYKFPKVSLSTFPNETSTEHNKARATFERIARAFDCTTRHELNCLPCP
jgi:hypothetical protein